MDTPQPAPPEAKPEPTLAEPLEKARQAAQQAKAKGRETLAEGESWVRQHPAGAALAGLAAGFILTRLPLRPLRRLAFAALKPAAILYGAVKLTQAVTAREKTPPEAALHGAG